MATIQMTEPAQNKPSASALLPSPRKRSWKSILGKVLLVFVALIAALCVLIATRPSEFAVARSATMAAPPDVVFAQVNDFHKWEAWSPWAKVDPNAATKFEGPTSGEGAKFGWNGNSDIGEGSMTIVESKPSEMIHINLAFVRPMAGTNDVYFTFVPEGNGTKVTWEMAGENGFMAKAVGLFIDCEKMCGDMFNQGLSSMKKVVESEPTKPAESAPAETAPSKPSKS